MSAWKSTGFTTKPITFSPFAPGKVNCSNSPSFAAAIFFSFNFVTGRTSLPSIALVHSSTGEDKESIAKSSRSPACRGLENVPFWMTTRPLFSPTGSARIGCWPKLSVVVQMVFESADHASSPGERSQASFHERFFPLSRSRISSRFRSDS